MYTLLLCFTPCTQNSKYLWIWNNYFTIILLANWNKRNSNITSTLFWSAARVGTRLKHHAHILVSMYNYPLLASTFRCCNGVHSRVKYIGGYSTLLKVPVKVLNFQKFQLRYWNWMAVTFGWISVKCTVWYIFLGACATRNAT